MEQVQDSGSFLAKHHGGGRYHNLCGPHPHADDLQLPEFERSTPSASRYTHLRQF